MNIIGASGYAKVIFDILDLNGVPVTAVWDDNSEIIDFMGYKIMGKISEIHDYHANRLTIAIGNNLVRKNIYNKLSNFVFPVLVHPKSSISKYTKLGEGTVIMAGVSINPNVTIGVQCIINTNCSIDHDCVIGDYAHISPNVALAGNVEIGDETHVGIGACIIQGVKVGKGVTIGAGAVVIRDIPDNSVVVGNPANIIKYK